MRTIYRNLNFLCACLGAYNYDCTFLLGRPFAFCKCIQKIVTLQLYIILVNQQKKTLLNRQVYYHLKSSLNFFTLYVVFFCKKALYSSITWKKEALPHMTFGLKMEFSISDKVRKKLVLHINFNLGEKNFFHFLWTLGGNRFTLYNIAHTIRWGWKLNAVTRWNQTELVPERNFTRLYNHLGIKSNL